MYDGDGVRFSCWVGAGPVTRHVSDVNASLPVTLDDGSRMYVWGVGLAYAVSGRTIEVYHTDRLGTVRAITDASGTIISTYRTDEFGVLAVTTGGSKQPFAFTGEPRDGTGLSYLRARYYDPTLGRFMSRDLWAGFTSLPISLNRAAYVRDNPTSFADPFGPEVVGAGSWAEGQEGAAAYATADPSAGADAASALVERVRISSDAGRGPARRCARSSERSTLRRLQSRRRWDWPRIHPHRQCV